MPTPPSATWTTPDTELFEAGNALRADELLVHILQNLQYLGTAHDHSGSTGDGGVIAAADPKALWYYSQGEDGPF